MKIANTIRSSQVHISVIVEITNDGQSKLPRKIASETLTANGQMKERLKLMGVMTLDDAIRNADEVAEEREKDARFYTFSRPDNHRKESCEKCAAEYRQLAEWLKDYKRLLERESCEYAISREEAIRIASGFCHPANVAKELAKLPSVNVTDTNVGKMISGDALDKIRTEISSLPNANPSYWHSGDMVDRDDVFDIIDKYKLESENKG